MSKIKETIGKAAIWVKAYVSLSAFFKQAWKYLALFFAGVIAALVYAMKQMREMRPTQNIQTGEFVNEQNDTQRIGKIKQKGENLTLDVSPREMRKQRRERRKEKKLQEETEKEESEQKNY